MAEQLEPQQPPWKIWHQLPLRPQPAELESLTSYITRVAQANGLRTTAELAALVGAGYNWRTLRSFPDGSATSVLGLTTLTGCTQTDLEAMTFLPLARRFGYAYSANSHPLHRFLQGTLASHLRYCPMCLSEQAHPYYRLHWRFLALTGCHLHNCWLLNGCGHCETRLSLLPLHPELTACPACHKDLRTCQSPRLKADESRQLSQRSSDLIFLLTPSPQPQEENSRIVTGKRYAFARQQKGLSLLEAASLMEQTPHIPSAIEYASLYKKATFLDYIQYADLLEYSLKEILSISIPPLLLNEDTLLPRVDEAIQEWTDQEQFMKHSINKHIGVPIKVLKKYPRTNSRLLACHKQRNFMTAQENQQREEELVQLVRKAIKQLEELKEPVTQRRIARLVGMTPHGLRFYPRVEALLMPIANKHWNAKHQSYLVSVQQRILSLTNGPEEEAIDERVQS